MTEKWLQLPPGRAARWIVVPRAELKAKQRAIHIARTTVAGCQTECGIVLKPGWDWSDQHEWPPHLVCEECYELIVHLNRVRSG